MTKAARAIALKLVVAWPCSRECGAKLLSAGVTDSRRSAAAEDCVSGCPHPKECVSVSLLAIGPESYNRLYESFGNLNRMLAWGHARVLENLLELVPDCPRAISDQFAASANTVKRALLERGRQIVLEQQTKAEADVAVAAASILARAEFVRRLEGLGKTVEMTLPKGAGPAVLACARQIGAKGGREALGKVAKLHFKTTVDALGEDSSQQ